jgi:hypothetical protein
MSYIHPRTGKVVFEEAILTKFSTAEKPGPVRSLTHNVQVALQELLNRPHDVLMELHSPVRESHLQESAWLDRVRTIDESRICGVITQLRLVKHRSSEEVHLLGRIEPKGPCALVLRDLMITAGTSFKYTMRFTQSKEGLREIITFDVNAKPGR